MSPKTKAWVRGFVDYAGLIAFLVTLGVTRSAVTASWAVVVGSIAGLVVAYVFERRIAPMPLATAALGIIFGGLTLIFKDERFIKEKPTILYSAFGILLLAGLWRGKNPLKMVLGDSLHLPDAAIRTLTIRFALMFFAMAIANEVVWRTQSTLTWGFFKFPGMAIVIFLFTLSQMPLIAKHTPPEEDAPEK